MARVILGMFAGAVLAFATIFAIVLAGHQIYPLPSDLGMHDPEAVGAYIRTLPAGVLALVAVAWFVGTVDGGVVAALISRRRWTVWPVAGLVAAAGILHVLLIPHPVLLQIGAVVVPLLGGFAASLLARRIVLDDG